MRSLFLASFAALTAGDRVVVEESSSLMQLKIPSAIKPEKHHVSLLGVDVNTAKGRTALLNHVRHMAENIKNEKIDDATAEALTQAVTTAEGLLTDLAIPAIRTEHQAAETMIIGAAAAVQACADHSGAFYGGGRGNNAVTELAAATEEERQGHMTCRGVEWTKHERMEETCTAWTVWTDAVPDADCDMPERSDREGVVQFLERLEAYVRRPASNPERAQTLMTNCHESTTAWEEKVTECNTDQTAFEGDFCAERTACQALGTCYAREEATFLRLWEAVESSVDARKIQFSTVEQINCFLGLITHAVETREPVPDERINQCAEDIDTSWLDIAQPTLADEFECPANVMDDPPCVPNFKGAEYGSLNQATAVGERCTACVEVTPKIQIAEVGRLQMPDMLVCAETEAGCPNSGIIAHSFMHSFPEVPVVVPMMSTRGEHPARARIFDITTTGFKAMIVEPSSEDGPHMDVEVQFIAMTAGAHRVPLANGGSFSVEAGRLNTKQTVEFPENFKCAVVPVNGQCRDGSDPEDGQCPCEGQADFETIAFQSEFPAPPAFLSALQSRTNNPESTPNIATWTPFLGVATTEVSATSANVILEKHEAGGNVFLQEEIGWIAAQEGKGCFSGVCFATRNVELADQEDGLSGKSRFWTGSWDPPTHQFSDDEDFNLGTETPVVVASMNSRNGNNGGWPRFLSADGQGFQMVIDECRVLDSERNHPAEAISVVAVSHETDLSVNIASGDICNLFDLDEDAGTCAEADIDCNHVRGAKAFRNTLQDGTCADQGYSQRVGGQDIPVPFIGTITITMYVRAAAVLD